MFVQSSSTVFGKPVCRLGLATRDDSALEVEDVHHALARGVNFLNWPGSDDVLSRTIAGLPDHQLKRHGGAGSSDGVGAHLALCNNRGISLHIMP